MTVETEQDGVHIEYMPISELTAWPDNPKDHDEAGILASIERFGFNDPPALDESSGQLVEGHGRVDVLSQMKRDGKKVPARVTVRETDGEWLVPVLRGLRFEDELDAEAYLVAHNRLTETGGWDSDKLHTMLSELLDAGEEALQGTGFTPADIDQLAKDALDSVGDEEPPEEFEELDPKEGVNTTCPQCGYQWAEKKHE